MLQRFVRVLTALLLVHAYGVLPSPAQAEPSVTAGPAGAPVPAPDPAGYRFLGQGWMFSNDLFGDGQDRWRTGSISVSRVWGPQWTGSAPARLGDLLEFRFQGQVIAPRTLVGTDPADRPFAGVLSVGLHSYGNFRGLELTLGGDLVVIGPQTGLDGLYNDLHRFIGSSLASDDLRASQIPDTIRPTLVAELGRSYRFARAMTLRPFAEARAGDETLIRVGADLTLGRVGQGELLAREPVTGQRYRVIGRSGPGFSFVLGGDIAYVSDSVYLPEERGYVLTDWRDRLRVGVHWQGENASAFFGMTYLGREFASQPEGQVVGSIQVRMKF